MCFTSWDEFREEFMVAFCPENEATTALMRLESDHYFQGKRNVEAYIDEFKDPVHLSGSRTPSHTLPPGVPMDVDHTRTFKHITQTCHCCGQTGHFSKEYDLWHDVCHMTLEEEDEFIQHILANHDAAMSTAARSTTHMATSEGTLVEREGDKSDFVRSNR
jgi:hypothetical protein